VLRRIAKIAAFALAFILVAGISAYLSLTLIIKSENTVIVPELVGKDVVYALELLTDLELNTKVKGSEYSPNIPKNHVIYQDPAAGAEIKKGRDIRIVISKGPKTVFIPNLIALSSQQARLILEENDVCMGELSKTYSEAVENDHIMAQYPPAGTMISRGACADLLVSLGPRPRASKMPDLSGLSLDEAMLSIEKMNLIIGEIKSADEKNRPRNIIVGQNPLSGYRVVAGSPVDLVINRKSNKNARVEFNEQQYNSLFRYRISNGFLKRHILVKLNSAGITSDLFDDYVKPGEEIWLIIPRDTDSTVFLYVDSNLVKTESYDAL
jgi:beta-lactam-binding protein with PASTA domain